MHKAVGGIVGILLVVIAFTCWHEARIKRIENNLFSIPQTTAEFMKNSVKIDLACWHEARIKRIENNLFSIPQRLNDLNSNFPKPPTDLPAPPVSAQYVTPTKENILRYMTEKDDRKMVDEEITRINESLTSLSKGTLKRHNDNVEWIRKIEYDVNALKDMDDRLFETFRGVPPEIQILQGQVGDIQKRLKETSDSLDKLIEYRAMEKSK